MATGVEAILGHRSYYSDESDQSNSSDQVEATRVIAVPAFNDAGDDGVFGAGVTVEVTFIFSQAVQVDTTGGTPSVDVLLSGTDARQALYLRGSGTRQLVFGYTLTTTDGEHGSLLVDPNTLALNGGGVIDTAGHHVDTAHQGAGSFFVPAPDVTAPQLQSASVDGSSLTLTFDEELDIGEFLSSGLFSVNVNGAAHSVVGVGIGQSDVILLLSPSVVAGDAVTVSYTAPTEETTPKLQDRSGNAAASFHGRAVTNDTSAQQQPAPPTNLTLEHHESGKLLVAWEAPGEGVTPTEYTVRGKESGDDWTEDNDVSETDVDGTSHVITGLTDGTEYAVRVIARNGDSESGPSNEATGTPREMTPPAASSTAVDGYALTLTFDETLVLQSRLPLVG